MMVATRIAALAFFSIMLCFPLIGGFQWGKDFLNELSDNFLGSTKGAPILLLAIPLLCASSIASLFVVRESSDRIRRTRSILSFFHKFSPINGDGNFDLYATIFILIPCVVYTVASITRHFSSDGISILNIANHLSNRDDSVKIFKIIGNVFGMVALVLFPFFLVPVSKHGPIIRLFGWDAARVLRLHIWSGRLIVFASLAHGVFHLTRWTNLLGERIATFVLPPRQCWISEGDDEDFELECLNQETDCSCYNRFLYLTGTMGAIALLLLLATSSNYIRRTCYAFFYLSHIVLAPLFLFIVVLHYNQAILFISPSILYYLAASIPIFQQRQSNPEGSRIVSVESLGSGKNRCISLTISTTEESVSAFIPGFYVQVLVPSISKVSHPFTVNKVPGQNEQLRIIFRTSGPFTTALADELMAGKRPTIHIDGYHGSPDRLSQLLQHETAVIVAAGIGITPYLSLLSEAVHMQSKQSIEESFAVQRIVLHWSCRDADLIRYCEDEYLKRLREEASMLLGFDIEINIHRTGPAMGHEEQLLPQLSTVPAVNQTTATGLPFQQSWISPSTTVTGNLPHFIAHTTTVVCGLMIAWFLYSNFQSNLSIAERSVAPLLIAALPCGVWKIILTLRPPSPFPNEKGTKPPKQKFVNIQDESSPLLGRIDSMATGLTDYSSDEEAPGEITLRYREGRPCISSIMNEEATSSHSIGVFCCGPPAIVQTIYSSIQQRLTDRKTAIAVVRPTFQVYDETFLM